jgi:hypothetical protein
MWEPSDGGPGYIGDPLAAAAIPPNQPWGLETGLAASSPDLRRADVNLPESRLLVLYNLALPDSLRISDKPED